MALMKAQLNRSNLNNVVIKKTALGRFFWSVKNVRANKAYIKSLALLTV